MVHKSLSPARRKSEDLFNRSQPLEEHHAASQFGLIPADALLLSVMPFVLKSDYQPCGDQPQAIDALVRGLGDGAKDQVLLGITGSGKTFTVASVIERTQRPTLVIAHNKTLGAQLYQEFKSLFPGNAVEYFVSYYDYYQPEAYVPSADLYIEKDAIVN